MGADWQHSESLETLRMTTGDCSNVARATFKLGYTSPQVQDGPLLVIVDKPAQGL